MTTRAIVWVALSLGVLFLVSHELTPPTDVQANVSASRREILGCLESIRPSAGRLFGQERYGAFRPGSSLSPSDGRRVREILSRDVSLDPLDRGLVNIIDGRFAAAVDLLERLADKNPGDARVINDLSVAYLASASQNGEPFLLFKALEAAEAATALDPALLEARFNRALALELLHLDDEAKHEWSAYVSIDSDSLWAKEASERRRVLTKPSLKEKWNHVKKLLTAGQRNRTSESILAFPQQSRLYAEEELLGRWGTQYLAGKEEQAEATLGAVRTISAGLARRNKDLLLAETVRAIDEAFSLHGSRSRLEKLARGHKIFSEALTLYEKQETVGALQKFEEGRLLLEEGGSPFAYWPRFYEAVVYYFEFDFSRSLTSLGEICRIGEIRQYKTLVARTYWMMGLNMVVQADPSPALDFYQKALRIFMTAGEQENTAAVYGLLGESYDYLGNSGEAWRYRSKAIALSDQIVAFRRLHSLLAENAEAALREHLPHVALRLQNTIVRGAREFGNPFTLSHALMRRGMTEDLLGQAEEGLKDFESARRAAEGVTDPNASLRLRAELASAEGAALTRINSSEALDSLNAAISIFAGEDHLLLAKSLYLQRAALYTSLGDVRRAAADLKVVIRANESYLGQVSGYAARAEFLQQSEKAFDELILLLIKEGDVAEAFEYVERAKASVLLASLRSPAMPGQGAGEWRQSVEEFTLENVKSHIPSGVTVVEYSVLKDRILIWAIRRGSSAFVSVPMASEHLDALVKNVMRAVDQGVSSRERLYLSTAYDVLLRPVKPYLEKGEAVILVPDKALAQIPFSALIDRETGEYFIESHEIGFSPSSSVYIDNASNDVAKEGYGSGALIIANPALRVDIFPNWAGMEVGKEMQQLAAIYKKHLILTKEEATPEAFIKFAGKFQVVHFAGHAFVNSKRPLLSGLALSGSGKTTGALYISDIYSNFFPETRVLVLAGCDTAASVSEGGSDLAVLAMAFFVRGVPAVVGSVWSVNDRTAGSVMEDLHKGLATGQGVMASLRHAQLRALTSDDERMRQPKTWAGFVVYGAARPSPKPN
jgi:CHAT domain-containing protein